MNGELIIVLDQMERERGISREVLLEAIESSLLSASKKSIGPARELAVTIDRETGNIKAFSTLIVVDQVRDCYGEISREEARKINPRAKIGDEVTREVTPENFGRIAAQTAKQVVIQKIREAEKNAVMDELERYHEARYPSPGSDAERRRRRERGRGVGGDGVEGGISGAGGPRGIVPGSDRIEKQLGLPAH